MAAFAIKIPFLTEMFSQVFYLINLKYKKDTIQQKMIAA